VKILNQLQIDRKIFR